jgi:hypothetical protein
MGIVARRPLMASELAVVVEGDTAWLSPAEFNLGLL